MFHNFEKLPVPDYLIHKSLLSSKELNVTGRSFEVNIREFYRKEIEKMDEVKDEVILDNLYTVW